MAAGRKKRVVRVVELAMLVAGLAFVSSFVNPSSAEESLEDKDVVFADGETATGGFDVRTTCADARDFIKGYFDDVSNTAPLELDLPGFKLGTPMSMGDATLTLNCGAAANYIVFDGPFTIAGKTIDTELALRWPDADETIPSVEVNLDATSTLADPLFRVDDVIAWAIDLTDTDGSGFDAGPLGADIELRSLKVHFAWQPDGATEFDATAETFLFQSSTAELSDDIAVGYLISLRVPAGSAGDPSASTLLAGIHVGNASQTEDDFTLGGVLRGAPGEIAGSIELPEMYLATVQPPGNSVSVTEIAARPLVHEFFNDHGPNVEGLPETEAGEPFSFDSNVTIAGEANLDFLGDDLRGWFGYDEGDTATAVGVIGLTFEDINSAAPGLDFQGVDIDITLPDLTGANAALLPSWVDLSNMKISIGWDADETVPSLLVEADADAAIHITDASQIYDDPEIPDGQVTIDTHLSAQLMVVPEGDGVTTSLGLRGETAAQPDPVWPHPFDQTWLDLNSLGAEIVLIDAADEPLLISGKVTSSFDIDGLTFVFTASIESDGEGTDVVFNLSLHDEITLNRVIEKFSPTTVLPAAFDGISVGPESDDDPPVSLTVRLGFPTTGSPTTYIALNTPATVNLTGAPGAGLHMGFLFSFRSDGNNPPVLTIGGRVSATTLKTALGGILPPALADQIPTDSPLNFALPDLGLVFTSGAISLLSDVIDETAPEEWEFYRHLYGCGAEPADLNCRFKVELDSGIHFLSSITPKKPGTDEPLFGDALEALSMDPNSSLLIQLSAGLPAGGGNADFGSLSFKIILPVKPATPPDWFDHAALSIEVAAGESGVSLSLKGALGVRIEDEPATKSGTCDEPKVLAQRAGPSGLVDVCYDVLTFSIDTKIELSTSGSVNLTITGALVTTGWHPFGIDWITVNAAKLQLGVAIDASGQPQFFMGLMVAGALFDHDFSGSIMIGVRIVPAAPSPIPVPDFKGIQISSHNGLGTGDIVAVYEFLAERAEMLNDLGQGVGISIPDMPDLSSLPDIRVKDLHLNVGLVDNPTLCIKLGLEFTGALYINGGVDPDNNNAVAPDGCPPPAPPPEECLNAATPCFAAVQAQATLEGLIISGGMGSFDLGPLHWNQALLDMRLTPSQQRIRAYGGATIDDVGTGQVDLFIGPTAVGFLGDIQLYGPTEFQAKVEGLAEIGAGNMSNLRNLISVDFSLHAYLQGDFGGAVASVIGPPIQTFRDAAAGAFTVYDAIKQSDGDVVDAVAAYNAYLVSKGQDPDPLLTFIVDSAQAIEDFLGIEAPTLGDVLGAACFLTGNLDEECSDVSAFLTNIIEPPLVVILNAVGIEGTDLTTMLETFINDGTGDSVPAMSLDCADFSARVSDGTGSADLRWQARVFSTTFAFGTQWDFNSDPAPQALALVDDVVGFLTGTSSDNVVCQPLGQVVMPGGGTVGLTEPTQEEFRLHLSASTINEGQSVTLSGTVPDAWLDEKELNLHWGDTNIHNTVEITAGDLGDGITHTYDDDKTLITSSDQYTIRVSAPSTKGPSVAATAIVTVRNVAPSGVTAVVDAAATAVNEGQQFTLSGSFTDPGDEATHTVTVAWGDGTPNTVLALTGDDRDYAATHTFVDDNPTVTVADVRKVKVTVADDDSGVGTVTRNVTVNNVAPSGIVITPTGSINEGDLLAYTVDFVDPGLADVHHVHVAWGDGSSSNLAVVPGAREVMTTHRYNDDPGAGPTGSYSAVVTVSDDDSGSANHPQVIGTLNVDPSAVALAPTRTVREGELAPFALSFTDPGMGDTHVATITWDDDSAPQVVQIAAGVRALNVNHTYPDDPPGGGTTGSYTASVQIVDDDTGSASANPSLPTVNVAPTNVTINPLTTPVLEGSEFSYRIAFADPSPLDTFLVDVLWGDGTSTLDVPVGMATRSVDLPHTYRDDPPTGNATGSYVATVTVTDDDTGVGSLIKSIADQNVAPPTVSVALSAGPVVENNSGLVTATVTWTDPSPLDTFSVVIDWGYGPTTLFGPRTTTLPAGAGVREVSASKTYGDNGSFTVSATVTDDDTGAQTGSANLVVDNADPTLAINESAAFNVDGGPTLIVRANTNLALAGTASDVGSDDLTFTWDWDASDRYDTTSSSSAVLRPPGQTVNDVLPSPEVNPNSNRSFSTTHRWSRPCLYDTELSVVDDDGGTASDNIFVVVTGTDTKRQITGWWAQQYQTGSRNKGDLDDSVLLPCYLEIARHMSAVFGDGATDPDVLPLGDADDALVVLDTSGPSDDTRAFDRQLLAALLNFAHGSIGWTSMVDTNCDRKVDTRFSDLITAAETERLVTPSSKAALISYKSKLECVNR